MVRTRAEAGATKVSAAKAPRKVLSAPSGGASTSFSAGKSSKDRYSGGNAYNPQPIPEWQKGINNFFKAVSKPQDGEGSSSGDGSSSGGGSSSSGGGSSSSGGGSSSSGGGSSSSSSSGGVDGCGGSSSNIISEERPGSSMSNNGTSCSFNKNGMISDDSDDD
ncbi:PCNA-associated factor-like [Cherax quadricarinatus]|uniref:PCNA-associated factor-like n=1 Tax=Cherax quadricarinatus TaxID=27406 RepID=UPI00387E57AF